MGAHTFHDQGFGATAKEAFDDLVTDAAYEFGHNPYSGTIATNDGFEMRELLEGETIDDWTERVFEDDGISKWGPCACVKDPDVGEENGRWLWHFAGWAAC